MSQQTLIGIDMGGTKIEAAALRWTGSSLEDLLPRQRIPTNRDEGYDAVLTRMAAFIRDFVKSADLDLATVPIGIGTPGGVTRAGLMKNSNTTCLNGRPFRQDLASLLGRPLSFENDANCFALAEAQMGAGAPYKDGVVFGVIMGTGCGGGLVLSGKLWPGPHGIAGEWGHHTVYPIGNAHLESIPCYCGQSGCAEQYLSGPAVERHYQKLSGHKLKLPDIVANRSSDPHAAAAIEQLLLSFGRALANLIDILDPSAIVLGGGVSNLDLLYTEGKARVSQVVFNDELTTPILKHKLGDSAGVLGAALLNLGVP